MCGSQNLMKPEEESQDSFVMPRSRFRSQMYRTEMCRFVDKPGGCPKGAACGFAHSNEELNPRPDLRKTSICSAWLTGTCRLPKERCGFAHGDEDRKYTALYQRMLPSSEEWKGDNKSTSDDALSTRAESLEDCFGPPGLSFLDSDTTLDTFATSLTSYPHVFGQDSPGLNIFNDRSFAPPAREHNYPPPPPPARSAFQPERVNQRQTGMFDSYGMPAPFMKGLTHQDPIAWPLKAGASFGAVAPPNFPPPLSSPWPGSAEMSMASLEAHSWQEPMASAGARGDPFAPRRVNPSSSLGNWNAVQQRALPTEAPPSCRFWGRGL